MHANIRRALGFGLIAVVSAVGVASPAWSDEHRGERGWERRGDEHRGAQHREFERRRELDRERAAAYWRFERDRGWRFEHRPGVWSPYFVWWMVDGRPLLRPFPTLRVVRYPTGYYELVGDGFSVPYYWAWRSTAVVVAPPPAPFAPPAPADYPFPAGGMYPPPPPVPQG